MKHAKKIFLTGEINVGKSTIISKFVKEVGIKPKGFNTLFGGRSQEEDCDYVYIIPYGAELDLSKSRPVAKRSAGVHNITKYPEVFDKEGTEILEASANADFIVMDELGFMESEARVFQQKVFACLDWKIPILGVIKPKKIDFLDRLRAHPLVEIIEVTPENREEIFLLIMKEFAYLKEKRPENLRSFL